MMTSMVPFMPPRLEGLCIPVSDVKLPKAVAAAFIYLHTSHEGAGRKAQPCSRVTSPLNSASCILESRHPVNILKYSTNSYRDSSHRSRQLVPSCRSCGQYRSHRRCVHDFVLGTNAQTKT